MAPPRRAHSEGTARLRARLHQGAPVLLDGAGGTALQEAGIDISGPLWSAEALTTHRHRVVDLHAAYARAGAEVHTALTFRTHPALFSDRGGEQAWQATLDAGVQAVEAGLVEAGVDREDCWVAGSMAPVGDSYAPEQVPLDSVLADQHDAQAQGLHRAGADLVLVETMLRMREARIAARAARATPLPVWVSFVVGSGARLLSGEPLERAVQEVESVGVDAVLVNCASLENTTDAVAVLAGSSRVPWGVYANGSRGDPAGGWGERASPTEYAEAARGWVQAGARIVGSCCATGPGHTKALAEQLARTHTP